MLGAGGAFALDAVSFLLSAAALLAMSRTHLPPAAGEGSTLRQIDREPARVRPRGLAFVATPVGDMPRLRLVGEPAATWLPAPQPSSLAHHAPTVTPTRLPG